jgi:thymidylate synthase
MKPISIEATTISDAWFQAVYNILDKGRRFVIDKGSYEGQTRLEYDYFSCLIHNPMMQDILPVIPPGCGIPAPVDPDYVYGGPAYKRSYIEYIMTGEKQENEQYTYGERLRKYFIGWKDEPLNSGFYQAEPIYLDQVQHVIDTYKKYGHRNNQMVLQIAQPNDVLLSDPPCLRSIDTRIQDNTLNFFVYFRSWDLWGGFPANLAGIQFLKEYMAGEIGVADGSMLVESKGLHLYGYAEQLANLRCLK